MPLLELGGIDKRFGNTVALERASLSVRAGTVHVLLGENGAGKTTLMRIAFGEVRPDAGTVRVRGTPQVLRSPADAIALGMGMVHQHYSLVPAMTVAENVALALRGHWRFRPDRTARLVRETADCASLVIDPSQVVADLSVAAQQRVEILKALATEARLLILDEPTAVLAPGEADELLAWVRWFRNAGGSVVLITHKMREALALADDITVLRHGRVVLAQERGVLDEATIIGAMLGDRRLGDEPDTDGHSSARRGNAPAVSARGLHVRDARGSVRILDATIQVAAGEIVGVAAVEGAGHRELLRVLAGRIPATAGDVYLPETIGFIPEDRQRDGLVLGLTLAENVALRGAGQRRGRMSWAPWAARTRDLVATYDIRGAALTAPVAALSGGNQQKLVLARELAGGPALIVAENPTRGLDVGATAAVHARLRAARAAGAAVVFYSSDLDEVLALADRVLVVHGAVVREVPRDRDLVGRAMLGAA